MADERFGSRIVGLVDVPFTVEQALVRSERSRVFDRVSVVCSHQHMAGLERKVEGSTQFLNVLEALHGINIVRSISASSTEVV